MSISNFNHNLLKESLNLPHQEKLIINTINAYSYVVSCYDQAFRDALQKSNILLPDGIGIVYATRIITGEKLRKIAGYDLFEWEMQRLERIRGKCFFLGSSDLTLMKICTRCKTDYPNVEIHCYAPPFKPSFSDEDNEKMLAACNEVSPDVLFIGMTAPKQEKWAVENFSKIKASHICCIGAVFDFYAGTAERAPKIMINLGLEWFYRLISEPKRLWKRYLYYGPVFVYYVLLEKVKQTFH